MANQNVHSFCSVEKPVYNGISRVLNDSFRFRHILCVSGGTQVGVLLKFSLTKLTVRQPATDSMNL